MARACKTKASPNNSKPKAVIDWDLVEQLLISGSDGVQISAYIGVHPETLYRRCISDQGTSFSEYAQTKRAKGDSLLLSAQFKEAYKNKNTALLIWLGKCRLKQKETKNYEHTGDVKFQVVNYGSKESLPYKDANAIEVKVDKVKDNIKEITQETKNDDTK